MWTFAPFNLNSLRDLNKYFIYLSVNKGLQEFKGQPPGIKGLKGLKHLSTLLTFYSCVGCIQVYGRLEYASLKKTKPSIPFLDYEKQRVLPGVFSTRWETSAEKR